MQIPKKKVNIKYVLLFWINKKGHLSPIFCCELKNSLLHIIAQQTKNIALD